METLLYSFAGVIPLLIIFGILYYCSKKGKKRWILGICVFLFVYFAIGPVYLLIDYMRRRAECDMLSETFRYKLSEIPAPSFNEKCKGKFIYYDLDDGHFNAWAYGSKYHSLKADEITVIVFHRKGRKHVGVYRNSKTGEYIQDAYQGYVDVVVVDVETWSIISQKTFEAESPPNKLEDMKDHLTNTDISTGKVRDYVDGLFENENSMSTDEKSQIDFYKFFSIDR